MRADGRVEPVGRARARCWASASDVRLHEVEAVLEPGDALLLYTDGVTEAGPRSEPFGEHGLQQLLATLGGVDPEVLVGAVDAAAMRRGRRAAPATTSRSWRSRPPGPTGPWTRSS